MGKYRNVDILLRLKLLCEYRCDVEENSFKYNELKIIINKLTKKELHNRLGNIVNFIKYSVDNKISWVDRLLIIKNVLKNDSSSLYSFNIRYGEKNGKEKISKLNS